MVLKISSVWKKRAWPQKVKTFSSKTKIDPRNRFCDLKNPYFDTYIYYVAQNFPTLKRGRGLNSQAKILFFKVTSTPGIDLTPRKHINWFHICNKKVISVERRGRGLRRSKLFHLRPKSPPAIDSATSKTPFFDTYIDYVD